jgi:hypothetical protein
MHLFHLLDEGLKLLGNGPNRRRIAGWLGACIRSFKVGSKTKGSERGRTDDSVDRQSLLLLEFFYGFICLKAENPIGLYPNTGIYQRQLNGSNVISLHKRGL